MRFFLTFLCGICFTHIINANTALIFGVTGQDGAYLTEFLLEKGYEVHGVKRKSSTTHNVKLEDILQREKNCGRLFLHTGDVTQFDDIIRLIEMIQPDEIYNLAAQSQVGLSFKQPEYTSEADALGTLRILEAIHRLGLENKSKFYQASSSEMFGLTKESPQKETTPFYPRSPYAIAKIYAYWMTINYRETYGMFAVNGILFNHESPLRGPDFVTRKITLAASRIKYGLQDVLYLGNLDVKRDWGYAKDYIESMWLMLQQDTPEDYVIGTGETHSLREFVELAFSEAGFDIEWQGEHLDEVGLDRLTKRILIRIDPRWFRPVDVTQTLSDPTKALNKLGWRCKTHFSELVKIMMSSDLAHAKQEWEMK